MSFFRIAVNSYKPNQKKKRRELKKNIINYYSLAGLGAKDLWSTAYNDSPYGKKLYDAIVKTVSESSVRCSYCQDKIFHNKNLNILTHSLLKMKLKMLVDLLNGLIVCLNILKVYKKVY